MSTMSSSMAATSRCPTAWRLAASAAREFQLLTGGACERVDKYLRCVSRLHGSAYSRSLMLDCGLHTARFCLCQSLLRGTRCAVSGHRRCGACLAAYDSA